MLREVVDVDGIDAIVDFGGDRGQFIPRSFGARRFVYEVSDAEPVDGVTRIVTPGAERFDLVMHTNVLEHDTAPRAAFSRFTNDWVAPGALLYLEVPYEQYDLAFVPTSGPMRVAYEHWLRTVCRLPALYKLVDFYSTAARIKLGVVPPGGFFKKHEHINFFTADAVRALVDSGGYDILRCETHEEHTSSVFEKMVVCIARRRHG
ncbi:MAG TPA: methyltransferase domain-containing protein [Myxococcota bacterium]